MFALSTLSLTKFSLKNFTATTIAIILSVCLCVCLFASIGYLWNRWTDLYEFFVQIPVAVAWSSSGGFAIRYVLPVVWMTSLLAEVGRMAMRCDTAAESDVYECLVTPPPWGCGVF